MTTALITRESASLTLWPTGDPLMEAGLISIMGGLTLCGHCTLVDFQFCHVARLTTRQFDFWYVTKERIYIIADHHLMPLARYYCDRYSNIVAVYDKSACLPALAVDIAMGYEPRNLNIGPYPALTQQECELLFYLLDGVNIVSVAKRMNETSKRIYTKRSALMKKLHINHHHLLHC